MTVLVIDIGNTGYGQYSIPLIKKLCDFNNVNLYILDKNISQNKYNLHPSWLKLFCFDLIDDNFIITWDLDLVPTKLFKFVNLFDIKQINLCYDPSYVNSKFTFNGKFKYNCGLMGIPVEQSNLFKSIYNTKGHNSTYPSYEQYHINDEIYDKNISVNLLDYNLNTLFDGNENFGDNVLNMHYTWRINSNEHRINLIKKHYEKYADNF